MGLSEEAQEFNEDQKKRRLYYETEGRHLSRVEDAITKLEKSIDKHLGYLIDLLQQWMDEEEKRRKEEYRRSTYGMYDPYQHRTQRGSDDHRWSGIAADGNRHEPYRNPFKQRPRRGANQPSDPNDGQPGPHLGGKH
jgi:hypothetical protein